MAQATVPVRIIFSTYQSAREVAKGLPHGLAFDLAIFDEAHKTAGREGRNFSFALADKNLLVKKRLFLTATPRHYDVRKRDKEGDAKLVYSMDVPEVYGPVAHTLTFAEAARRGIICNYKVIISVVTSDTVSDHLLRHGKVLVKGDEIHARQVANQLALKAAVEKHGVSKIFTFHRSVASAKSFVAPAIAVIGDRGTASGEGIGNHLPDFACFHVNGTMSTAEREGYMDEFRAAPKAVMSNARCLTEGVDVPAVDMVAFLTPKRSKVDIVQATGRAMRKAARKTTGYILVPLFVEQSKGETIEQAIARAEFDEVWAVLQAMQEQDDVLDDRIHYVLATSKKTKGFNDAIIRQRVEITGPAVALDKLRRAITVKCLDRIGRRWDTMVQQLLLFKKRYGHFRIAQDAHKPWNELGEWAWKVRQAKRIGTLSAKRVSELETIGFDWRVEGQTLDDTSGLLNEDQFRKTSGLTNAAKYRIQGLVKPVGKALTPGGLSYFYHPRQIKELKKLLGITLDDTTGLFNEKQFMDEARLSGVARYREQGLIKPVGKAITNAGLSYFYHPRQIRQLRKKLGITLDDTTGLLNENQFAKVSGLTMVRKHRQQGLIKPVGRAMTYSGLSLYYHPRQVKELKKKLGITLNDITGLLNEKQFAEVTGLTQIYTYRNQGLIKPVGTAITNAGLSNFYHPRQIKELKKKLGITLDNTTGLLPEDQFRKLSGLTPVAKYRQQGLIKPVGRGMSTHLSYFYHPRQIKELKKKLGITLDDTTGLLNETQFGRASGVRAIARYRQEGLIKPVGRALGGRNLSYFYHPRQIKELKKKMGVTLDDTTGLLSENQFGRVSGFTEIARYRQLERIKPVGKAIATGRISCFYHRQQIEELEKKLGITLKDTTGLLNESQFRKASGLSNLQKYRQQGLIKPVGRGKVGNGLSRFYHPRQIKELRKNLGITIDNPRGLITEQRIRERYRLSRIERYRQRGLIKPIGKGLTSGGIHPLYHPRQIRELKQKLASLKKAKAAKRKQ